MGDMAEIMPSPPSMEMPSDFDQASDGPARKQQKKNNGADADAPSQTAASGSSSSNNPSGPPYICPTCQTSYSRLEYLRRHERRHADIRPFVCECGKGFSRSDVLSRHKKQCAVFLNGGSAEDGSTQQASRRASAPKARRSNNGGKAKKNGANSNGNDGGHADEQEDGDASGPTDNFTSQSPSVGTSTAGFPFSTAALAPPSAPPPLLPPAPYGVEGSNGGAEYSRSNPPYGLLGGSLNHLASLGSGFNQQHNYPSSPESNGTLSQHGSPRFTARDMSRHGSNSSRFSLRKSGGSFDHIAPRSNATNSTAATSNHYSQEFWDALDPAAKGASLQGNDFASSSNPPPPFTTHPPFSLSAEANAGIAAASGVPASTTAPGVGATTPRGEPQRFAVSTGPLSPFSSIALTSSMSPYLSAFSNARDTPFVASPSRGALPGTPGSSSMNVFDWTMRPPSKPASSTNNPSSGKRDSISQQGNSAAAAAAAVAAAAAALPQGSGVGPKRKREEEEQQQQQHAGKRPSLTSKQDEDDATAAAAAAAAAAVMAADPDQRTAAELLDSLRTSGTPRHQSGREEDTSANQNDIHLQQQQQQAQQLSQQPQQISQQGTEGSKDGSRDSTKADGENGQANNHQSFFERRNVTAGPEAFLLRLQGGLEESRAGLLGPDGNVINTNFEIPFGNTNGMSLGTMASQATPSSNTLSAPSPGRFWGDMAALWASNGSTGLTPQTNGATGAAGGNSNTTTSNNNNNNMSWLLSPGVQQIINSFNGKVEAPGEGGSYFAGAPLNAASGEEQANGSLPSFDANANGSAEHKVTHTPQSVTSLALERALKDVENPFYLPPHLFRSCYSITHWALPPLTRLSVLALHSQQNLLKHFPILHEPTFRLDTTPGCLAFAMCMLGNHQVGRMWWAGEEVIPKRTQSARAVTAADQGPKSVQADVGAQASSHELFPKDKDEVRYDEEDGQELVRPIVMMEKVDMLIRSFASRAKSLRDKVFVVEALMLFQSNNFLSSDPATRSVAAYSHSSVVNLARKAGLFDVNAPHAQRVVTYTPDDVLRSTIFEANDLCFSFSLLPNYLPSCSDEEKLWRCWSDFAGRRRTAFLILIMDTVASLDAGLPVQIGFDEVCHLPLPSPDTVWRAPNSTAWRKTLERYRGLTFDEAMSDLLTPLLSDDEALEQSTWKKDSSTGIHTVFGGHGPFARLVMVIALLRGIIHMLEGRSKRVPKESPVETWLAKAQQETTSMTTSKLDRDALLFRRALARWRKAWDSDNLCLGASGRSGQLKAAKLSTMEPDTHHLFASRTASGATPLSDDALPFFWLAQVLLHHGSNSTSAHEADFTPPNSTVDSPISAGGNSPDFKTMLRVAKNFVDRDENVNVSDIQERSASDELRQFAIAKAAIAQA